MRPCVVSVSKSGATSPICNDMSSSSVVRNSRVSALASRRVSIAPSGAGPGLQVPPRDILAQTPPRGNVSLRGREIVCHPGALARNPGPRVFRRLIEQAEILERGEPIFGEGALAHLEGVDATAPHEE